MVLRSLSFYLIPFIIMACGQGQYREVHEKNYTVALKSNDSSLQEAFQDLFSRFRQESGVNHLTLVHPGEPANSTIELGTIQQGHQDTLGWGQWTTETTHTSGTNPSKVVRYSMQLQLDQNFVMSRINRPEEIDLVYLLLVHEIGHGLQLNHDESNRSSVMFPYINSDEKDFPAVYCQMRKFFEPEEC